jgi:Flp pilus assembly CpaF family ATPase
MSSLDRILPFLKPIEDLLRDPAVTELMVKEEGRCVFREREGGIELVPGRTLESRNLTVAIKNIARACGDEISEIQRFSMRVRRTGQAWPRCSRRAR